MARKKNPYDKIFGGGGGGGSRGGGGGGRRGGQGGDGGRRSGGGQANRRRVRQAEREREERRKPEYTEKQLFRLGARLWTLRNEEGTDSDAQDKIEKALRSAFAGYPQGPKDAANIQAELNDPQSQASQRARKIAHQADVPEGAIRSIFEEVRPPYQADSSNPFVTAMEYLGRPAEAVKGFVSKGAPEGAWAYFRPWDYDLEGALEGAKEGITGERTFEGLQTFAQAQGASDKGARKFAESVPGPVRFVANTAIDAAVDPLSYVTLGATAGAKAAGRSAAKILAEQTGNKVDDVLRAVTRRGWRGLDDAQQAVIRETAPALENSLKGASGGVKVVGRTIPGTDAPQAALRGLSERLWNRALDAERGPLKALTKLEQAVSPRGGARQLERAGRAPRGFADDLDAARAEYQAWRSEAERRTAQALRADRGDRRLTSLFKGKATKPLTDAEREQVFRAMDVGGRGIDDLPPELAERAQVLDRLRQQSTGEEVEWGLLDPERMEIAPDEYMARYLTPEGAAESGRRAETGVAARSGAPGDPVGGPYRGGMSKKRFGRDEETRFTPAADLRTESGAPKFDLNPARVVARRSAESARDVARVRFVDRVQQLTLADGTPVLREWDDTLGPGWTKVDVPAVVTDVDGVRTASKVPVPMAVRSEVADDFARIVQVMTDDAAMQHLLKGIDKYMGLWKSYATIPVPFGTGFTLRNMEGNYFNGYWLTNTNPVWSKRAMGLQRKMWKGRREAADPFAFLDESEAAAAREAFDNGILDSGFYEADLDEAFDLTKFGGNKADRLKPWKQEFAPLELGRRVNTAVEQNARLGVYLGQRAKGLLPEDAASVVRKYLFDYADLSDVDRAAKKFSPFWTFLRKNTPLQIESIVKQPGKYSNLEHVLQNLSGPHESEDMPKWMIDAGAVALPDWANPNDETSAWVPDLPPLAAGEVLTPLTKILPVVEGEPDALKELARSLVNAAGVGGVWGVPKALVETAAGGLAFTGRPFFPGEQVTTPAYLEPLRKLGLVGDTIPYESQFLAEQAMPLFPKVRGILPTDESDEDKQGRRLASMFTGQSLQPLGEATQRGELYRRLQALQALQQMLSKRGYVAPDTDEIDDVAREQRDRRSRRADRRYAEKNPYAVLFGR